MDHSLDHSLEEPLGWGPFHSQTESYDDRGTAAQYRTRARGAPRAPACEWNRYEPNRYPHPRSTRIQLTLYTK
jgi:hypothetical protein